MTTRVRQSKPRRTPSKPERQKARPQWVERYFPAWLLLAVIVIMLLPDILVFSVHTGVALAGEAPGALLSVGDALLGTAFTVIRAAVSAGIDVLSAVGGLVADGVTRIFASPPPSGAIAPLFTDEVLHWEESIERWATTYALDPNLLATVMQIESCGHPNVSSHAGAQGLFQVMPYHFAVGESQLDPDTNAMRGADVLNDCLRRTGGNAGLAMACYNGGPSVIGKAYTDWFGEVQRYYTWGTGIYADAQKGRAHSSTLDSWLNAGGINLCNLAAVAQASD